MQVNYIAKKELPKEPKTMEIKYILPGKSRPRVINIDYDGVPANAFRIFYQKFPNATPIEFDGRKIKKSV